MGSGYELPTGIAVDSVGDEGKNQVLNEDFADPPSLTFANTTVVLVGVKVAPIVCDPAVSTVPTAEE